MPGIQIHEFSCFLPCPLKFPPPSPFRVLSPCGGLCQGLPREQWSPTFRSPTQVDQTTSCQEITQTDPCLDLCSEFTVSRKHLQFCSFPNRHIPSHRLGLQLQLMEANQGPDIRSHTWKTPLPGEQREGLTSFIPSSPSCLFLKKKGMRSFSPIIYLMYVKVPIQRK